MPRKTWFEDFQPGEVVEIPEEIELREDEIVEFAKKYDPQPFHIDKAAAEAWDYGGLIASGWQTAGTMMRLLVDHYIPKESSLGSPGIDELRWLKPVRPGDRLHIRVITGEAVRSRSKPDRGVVHATTEVINQHGEIVMRVKSMGLYRCRPS